MSEGKGISELLRKAGYSEKAIDYYMNKVNVGVIEGAEAVDSYMGLCGDSMSIYLKIDEGVIKDAKFQAIGCAGAFASGSALTEMVKGMKLKDAKGISEQNVLEYLGKMPGPKLHCVRLAIDALRKSIESYTKQ
jgi:nitrogen fixation NifU-like protein